ncbi:MAG: serine/threonine-protein kinase [bacterium]|nr:serine/threonine-protein kinase [bacterium]
MKKVFGNYTLVERIGVGGMGEVHRAIKGGPDGFRVEVALKLILPHLARDDAFRTRFSREARLAARLNHPNIVRVHGFDIQDGSPFIEMEYVAGADLAALIRTLCEGERLPLPQAVHIIHGVARGLAYAHSSPRSGGDGGPAAGPVVHRDLNPHNILLSYAGEVKIADFGIARASLADITASATLMGKLAYMAPEQVDGKPLDHRCDLFSLGITAYQLFTGVHPFKRASEAATLIAVQKASFRPIEEFIPELPKDITAAIASLLAADPEDRPASAAQIADIMEKHVEPGTSAAVARRVERASAPVQGNITAAATAQTMQRLRKPWTVPVLGATAAGLTALLILVNLFSSAPVRQPDQSAPPTQVISSPPSTPVPASPGEELVDARVRVVTVPQQADIFMKGTLLGRSPLTVSLPSEEGEAEFRAELPAFSRTRFTLRRDQAGEEVIIELTPIPMVTVHIQAVPWARIMINGKDAGETPRDIELPIGQQLLTLVNPVLGVTKEIDVMVHKGMKPLTIDMEER